MTTSAIGFDVAVVGGCTAARLFAGCGASVALVERHTDPAAYKVTCTHAILPPATPTIERLGLAPIVAKWPSAACRELGLSSGPLTEDGSAFPTCAVEA